MGILGAARITPAALVYPAETVPGIELVCVAARDRARAQAFATEHGVGEVLDDYAAVVASDLDALYVPLPISAHQQWTLAALDAGLHVLCEKAVANNAREARRMADAARAADRVLMEAFHYRYHPLMGRVLELVAGGAVGRVRHLEGRFCVPHIRPGDIRLDYGTGGGALMDLGCYCVHALRHVAGREPAVARATAVTGPPKVDVTMTAELAFPTADGPPPTGRVYCSMDPAEEMAATLVVEGDAGALTVQNFVAPQLGHELRLVNDDGELREQVDRTPSYTYQLEAFLAAVRGERANLTDGEDAVRNMQTIDAIYLAAGLPLRGA
jgi:predicted dehydrogenase